MTYKEVLNLKEQYGNSVIENNSEFLILIVPNNLTDLIKFLSDFKESEYTDEDCKKYSSDNQYQLYANMSEHSRNLLF